MGAFGGLLALSLMTVSSPCLGQVPPVPSSEGAADLGQDTAAVPSQVVLGNLPSMTDQLPTSPLAKPLGMPFSPAAYQALKDAARSQATPGNTPGPQALGGTGPIEHDTPTSSLLILPPVAGDEGNAGNLIPSDMAVAASPSYVIQVVNSRITVLDTSGNPAAGFPKSLNAFFSVSGDLIGDIRALYDPHNTRWIVTAEDFTANNLLLAASQSSNPTSGWWIYTIGMGTLEGDFPMLGQSMQESGDGKGAIYSSWLRFNANGSFSDNFVAIFPKSKVYAGSSFSYNYFYNFTWGGATVDTLQPANVMNNTDRPRCEYLMNTFNFNFASPNNGVVVWAIKNGVPASGSPSVTSTRVNTVNNYSIPPSAPQPGASGYCYLDTGTARFNGEVTYSAGSLYGAIPNNTGVQMFVIHPTLNASAAITSATMLNEIVWGVSGFTGGGQAYYPTMQPDPAGNFTMVCNYSSPTIYPSTAFLSGRVSQAFGTLNDSGYYLAGGQAFYCQLDQYNRDRWGDYTAACPSYTAPGAFWFSGQYSESSGNWGTAIGKNGYTGTGQP